MPTGGFLGQPTNFANPPSIRDGYVKLDGGPPNSITNSERARDVCEDIGAGPYRAKKRDTECGRSEGSIFLELEFI